MKQSCACQLEVGIGKNSWLQGGRIPCVKIVQHFVRKEVSVVTEAISDRKNYARDMRVDSLLLIPCNIRGPNLAADLNESLRKFEKLIHSRVFSEELVG